MVNPKWPKIQLINFICQNGFDLNITDWIIQKRGNLVGICKIWNLNHKTWLDYIYNNKNRWQQQNKS